MSTSLIGSYELQVQLHPMSPALKLENGNSFNFLEIDSLAKKIQMCLQQQIEIIDDGVGTPLVAVMMTRGLGFIVTILAVLKAGAAYVPVDPAFPPDRQSYIFSHSKCQLLVADHDSYLSALNLGAELPKYVIVDTKTGEVDFGVSHILRRNEIDWTQIKTLTSVVPTDESLAYVLYTSGSTGKPKGVMVKQLGVANIVEWFANELNIGSDSIVMGLTTFCFDISVLEIFLPLTRGGLLIMANSSTQKDPFRLIELMNEFKVTVFQATPATYEMMLATGWQGSDSVDFLVGGEAFRSGLLPLVDKSSGRCRSVRNVYGPTETTIWSLSYTVPEVFAHLTGAVQVPIGSAISRTLLYVVGEKEKAEQPWKEVEFGAEGELWIGGIGVAKGYLHAPALTAEKFLPNPFGEGVVYRTGDLVKQCIEPYGEYVFVRRMDDQVKVDGYRIELAEIESAYIQQPTVEQAVALVRNNKLVVYLKLSAEGKQVLNESGEDFVTEELKSQVAKSLTYYMVPKFSMIVEAFPQTANGKIDRKALPDPPGISGTPGMAAGPVAGAVNTRESVATQSLLSSSQGNSRSMALHVIEVIAKLRDHRPTANSSFASLGLDSLGSIMFIRALSVSLDGLSISPATLYAPGITIRSFARELTDRLRVENPALLRKITGEEDQDYPYSGEDECDIKDTNGDPATTVTAAEADYDDALVSSVRFLQGMRGILTLMVLWDHFHSPAAFSTAVYTDTFLFVIMSGFTTALQLRVPPTFENSNATNEVVLQSRKTFQMRNFFTTRALGLLPILWLALLANAPYWYYQDMNPRGRAYQDHVKGLEQDRKGCICTFLYIFGLQSWSPDCQKTGPDNVVYASYLIICFIIYALVRYFYQRLQDDIMKGRSLIFTLPFSIQAQKASDIENHLTTSTLVVANENARFLTKVANFVTALSYNRVDSIKNAITVTLVWLIVFAIPLLAIAALNPVGVMIFVPYFLAGVTTSSVTEMWFYLLWKPKTNEESRNETFSSSNFMRWWNIGNRFQPPGERNEPQESTSLSSQIGTTLWRFFPDILAVLSGVLLSPTGRLTNPKVANLIQFAVMPCILVIYLVVSFLQTEGARNNLTRYVFESAPLNALGYIAYPVYLFQRIIMNWYLPLIVLSIQHKKNEFFLSGYKLDLEWFIDLNYGWRVLAIAVFFALCWLLQKFYQDTFMLWLYSKVSERMSKLLAE